MNLILCLKFRFSSIYILRVTAMLVMIKKKKLYAILLLIAIFSVCLAGYSIFIKRNISVRDAAHGIQEYLILIQIDEKKLYLYKDKNLIKEYPIASGKDGWPSPIGKWKIISKSDWGEGFGGRWMGLDVRWGRYGIHGTTRENTIGRSASHGCIRMYKKDIKELYALVPHGTTVIINNGPFGPFGTGFRDLAPGDRGADVLAVQGRLKALGYFNGYESGIYGDDLKRALNKFQKDNSLEIKHTITRDDYHAMGFREFE